LTRGPNAKSRDKARQPRIAASTLSRLGNLVTYDAPDRRSGRCSQKASAAEDVTRDAAYDGTRGRAFLLMRHPGTTAQADQNCCRNCAG
jgi:hypothetical protein